MVQYLISTKRKEAFDLVEFLLGYLLIMQLVAIFITVRDKRSAKKDRWRVKESTLLLVSALGGSVAMLLTMKMIRHKTQKNKFMIGIPAIIVLQVAVIVYVLFVL